MSNDLLVPILTAILSGGVFHFLLGLIQARRQAPAVAAEVKKMALDGDSLSVSTSKEALQIAVDRIAVQDETIEMKDRQLLDKDRRINELEARILMLQKQLTGMQSTLTAMSTELEALRQLVRQSDDDDPNG